MLPAFNAAGDLPPGVHPAAMAEVVARFGVGNPQRQAVTARLIRTHALAQATGMVQHFLLFGSYITDKAAPNDVDVVLVMRDEFKVASATGRRRDSSIISRPTMSSAPACSGFGPRFFWSRWMSSWRTGSSSVIGPGVALWR